MVLSVVILTPNFHMIYESKFYFSFKKKKISQKFSISILTKKLFVVDMIESENINYES
jgi:hypothetical protein